MIVLISAIQRAHFSYFSQGFFYTYSTVLFFFLVLFFLAGLHCLLRIHAINSCVDDTWQRLWRDDFTHNGKQVVNRLKIPQGLSTLMFRRWSEFPQGEGSAVIHRKKNRPALQRCDILTASLGSSFFREFVYVFFHPVLSGSVLLSSPWNCSAQNTSF